MNSLENSPSFSPTDLFLNEEHLSPALIKILNRIVCLKNSLTAIKATLCDAQKDLIWIESAVEKYAVKEMKATANSRKTKKPASGFAKPGRVSDVMCYFMGVEPGTLLSRTECTKYINQYIKDNGLKKNKTNIEPDDKLLELVGPVSEEDPLTYFNLQKKLNLHFTFEK